MKQKSNENDKRTTNLRTKSIKASRLAGDNHGDNSLHSGGTGRAGVAYNLREALLGPTSELAVTVNGKTIYQRSILALVDTVIDGWEEVRMKESCFSTYSGGQSIVVLEIPMLIAADPYAEGERS